MIAELLIAVLTPHLAAPQASAVALPEPAQPAAAQDDEQPDIVDKRPEIKELLEKLKKHVAKRGAEDTEAVQLLDQLLTEFPQCGPKDRAAIVKGLGKCFEVKRRPIEEGVPDNRLYIACAVCLGQMGPESVPVLQKWIGHKKHRKDIALQSQLITALGKCADKAGVDTLLGLLKDKSSTLISASAQALSNYREADQKIRKKIFGELLKLMMGAKADVDADTTDPIARDKWDTIHGSINTTLQELTGHDERVPEKWERWWNKNKKKDWDKDEEE